MKRPVVWSSAARDDYIDAIRYIAERNPDAAERVALRVDRAAAGLAGMPTGRPGRVTGTYEKVVTGLPYIIVYEIVRQADAQEAVAILHVIHGARDWPDEAWPQD